LVTGGIECSIDKKFIFSHSEMKSWQPKINLFFCYQQAGERTADNENLSLVLKVLELMISL
jgi:hypothetical protein